MWCALAVAGPEGIIGGGTGPQLCRAETGAVGRGEEALKEFRPPGGGRGAVMGAGGGAWEVLPGRAEAGGRGGRREVLLIFFVLFCFCFCLCLCF